MIVINNRRRIYSAIVLVINHKTHLKITFFKDFNTFTTIAYNINNSDNDDNNNDSNYNDDDDKDIIVAVHWIFFLSNR